MLHLKKFESWYGVAARLCPEYTKPIHTEEYRLSKVNIEYPSGIVATFNISSENINSDSDTIRINSTQHDKYTIDRDLNLLIEAHGSQIQFEDYDEFIFIRCYNNPQDLIDHTFAGYLIDEYGRHIEISIKFNINCIYNVQQPNYRIGLNKSTPSFNFILINYLKIKSTLTYTNLKKVERKLQSVLIDKEGSIDIIDLKSDLGIGCPLIVIIYSLSLYDNKYINLLKMGDVVKYQNLLDYFF